MPYKYKGTPAPKRKAAKSQARLKASAAKSYTKAPSYGYSRTVSAAPRGKSKVVTGGAKFPTGQVSLTGKTPLITTGPKPGAGVAQPGVRKKAPPTLTAKQNALVASAMPKAKAQRSKAQIAAMHAYRAAGGGKKKRKKTTTRKLYGPRDFY